jgi:hypothetical protein
MLIQKLKIKKKPTFSKMSEGHNEEEIITARKLNNARNKRDKAELEYLKLVIRFQHQSRTEKVKNDEEKEEVEEVEVKSPPKKKESAKKREKPEASPQEEEEQEKPKTPKKKEKKEKPADWVCEGNLLDETPCPLTADAQEMSTDTRHLKALHHTCKECKKAMKKLKKEKETNDKE